MTHDEARKARAERIAELDQAIKRLIDTGGYYATREDAAICWQCVGGLKAIDRMELRTEKNLPTSIVLTNDQIDEAAAHAAVRDSLNAAAAAFSMDEDSDVMFKTREPLGGSGT